MRVLCRYAKSKKRRKTTKHVRQLAYSLRPISLVWKFMFGIRNLMDLHRWQRNNYGAYLLNFKVRKLNWSAYDDVRITSIKLNSLPCRLSNAQRRYNVLNIVKVTVFENDRINGILRTRIVYAWKWPPFRWIEQPNRMVRLTGAAVQCTRIGDYRSNAEYFQHIFDPGRMLF